LAYSAAAGSQLEGYITGLLYSISIYCDLQCFDTVGWATGRASSL